MPFYLDYGIGKQYNTPMNEAQKLAESFAKKNAPKNAKILAMSRIPKVHMDACILLHGMGSSRAQIRNYLIEHGFDVTFSQVRDKISEIKNAK